MLIRQIGFVSCLLTCGIGCSYGQATPSNSDVSVTEAVDSWDKRTTLEFSRCVQDQLTKNNGRWYIQFTVKDKPLNVKNQQFYAPSVKNEFHRMPQSGFIEFADIGNAPSARATFDSRRPGVSRVRMSKAIGRYRVSESEPKRGSRWGVEKRSTIVWSWTGELTDGKLSLEPNTEQVLGRNGPLELVHGDLTALVAILLGVESNQVTSRKPNVDEIPPIAAETSSTSAERIARNRNSSDPYYQPPTDGKPIPSRSDYNQIAPAFR